eukprot:gene3396-13436_t
MESVDPCPHPIGASASGKLSIGSKSVFGTSAMLGTGGAEPMLPVASKLKLSFGPPVPVFEKNELCAQLRGGRASWGQDISMASIRTRRLVLEVQKMHDLRRSSFNHRSSI